MKGLLFFVGVILVTILLVFLYSKIEEYFKNRYK